MADLLHEEHRALLRLHSANLVALLNLGNGLLSTLFQEQVLSELEMQNIRALRDRPTLQNETLLMLLHQKTREQFDRFTTALYTTNQLELHRLLTLGGDIIRIHVTGLSPSDERNFLITLGHPNNAVNRQNLAALDSAINFFEELRVKFAAQGNSVDFYSQCDTVDLLNDLCRWFWSGGLQHRMKSVIGEVLGKVVDIKVELVVPEGFDGGKEGEAANFWDSRSSRHVDRVSAFMLPSKEFISKLYVKELLSYDESREIERLRSERERNGAILDMLATNVDSKETFDGFVDALEATRQWFVMLILGRTPDVMAEDMETDNFPASYTDSVAKRKGDWRITILDYGAKTEPVIRDESDDAKKKNIDAARLPESRRILYSGVKTEPVADSGLENKNEIDVLYFTEYVGNISEVELQLWWSNCRTRCSVDSCPTFHRRQPGRDPGLMLFYLLALSSAMRKNNRNELARLLFFLAPSDENDLQTLMLGFSGFDVRQIRALISKNIKQASEYFPSIAYFQANNSDGRSMENPTVMFFAFDSVGDPDGKFQRLISVHKNLQPWTKSIPDKIVNQISLHPGEILRNWIACVAGNFSEVGFYPNGKAADFSGTVSPLEVGLSSRKPDNVIETLWSVAKNSVVIEPPDTPFRGLLAFVQSAGQTFPFLSYSEYVRRCVADAVVSSRRRLRYPHAAVAVVMEIGAELGLEEADDVMRYCGQGTVWRAFRVGDNGLASAADGSTLGIMYIYV